MAARLEKDQDKWDWYCSHLSSSRAIKAVQIWMRRAFSLVPTKVFTLRCCFRVLKNSSIFQRSR